MVITNGATLKWGWVYVAARAMYPVMVSTHIGPPASSVGLCIMQPAAGSYAPV
jgi:hypothetical protein